MHSKIVILKCGGSVVKELSDSFFNNIRYLQQTGMKPIIVHGGGPAIQYFLQKMDMKTTFRNGLRITSEQVMEVVEMVLVGHVNPFLTRKLDDAGINTIGISGSDQHLLKAEPIDYEQYGFVGEISSVNSGFLHQLLAHDTVPVIAPIAIGKDGRTYNVNADSAAGAIASALTAKQLIFVTDVAGILKEQQLIEKTTIKEVKAFIQSGLISGGMIPKVTAAINGLSNHVEEVVIVSGKKSKLTDHHHLLGTTIYTDENKK